MSDSQKPPREWWISPYVHEQGDNQPSFQYAFTDRRIYPGTDTIHVIEYSAYDKVLIDKKKNAELWLESEERYKALMQQALAMREALALYADPKNHEDHGLGSITEADAIIALEKFDEFMRRGEK